MVNERLILQPKELLEAIPHWKELHKSKLPPLSKAPSAYVDETGCGGVLSVPTIIVSPAITKPGGYFIIAGMNRSITAIIRRVGLMAVCVREDDNLELLIPHESRDGVNLKHIADMIKHQRDYESERKLDDTYTMANLMWRHRDFIRSIHPTAIFA